MYVCIFINVCVHTYFADSPHGTSLLAIRIKFCSDIKVSLQLRKDGLGC